ncbi:hypothetical protein [Argonema galeatum]|uniref:WD40 domain-containing protein n=1 Tax=Argonema galeatum TaxID=2942762 RepID=UPI002011BB93|nr:hypothetical protein [Argonema galeatum]MCL1468287.1 hypothetical protein [Argonema galeatum A003/A1]
MKSISYVVLKLTETEKLHLQGLLCGYSPAEIAKKLHKTRRGVEADLCKTLYRYIETLTERKPNSLENWRNIVDWLAEYRKLPLINLNQDWGDAPDVPAFFGRDAELATLKQWILEDRCRLIAILGIGGIGKTAVSIKLGKGGIGKTDLSLKLAREIQDEFDYIIWRKLLNAPPVTEILSELIQFLSNQQISDLPVTIDKQISLLLQYLKQYRCLLILDNAETILEAGNSAGKYRQGYEEYGQLFEKIGEVPHQSCLLLTSREKMGNIERLVGKNKPVRFFPLKGLNYSEGRDIFAEIDDFSGSDDQWKNLIEFYEGNPLVLELVAHHIKNEFAGDISEFLSQGKPVFAHLRELLDWHFARLSNNEKEIMYWLAIHREPVYIASLKDDIVSAIAKERVAENLRSLQNKLPLEKSETRFTLQPVLIEYITDRLIEKACEEVKTGQLELFNNQALILATSKDYVRESQSRTILDPVKERLVDSFTSQQNLEKHLKSLLSKAREDSPLQPGYTGGNILNLLCQLKTNLKGYDFSYLTIWQAYLQGIDLQDVNFSYSDLNKSIFTQSFGGIHALAFSPDGKVLAVGDSNGQIRLLRLEDEQPIATFQKHGWWTVSVAFSPDGEKLVSSSIDGTIKLWNVKTSQCLHNLEGHTNWVWTVAFSPDHKTIASGSNDKTIKLWDANTGECIKTLEGHTGWVLAVNFSSDGQTLLSGSYDKTIKLWDVKTFKCFNTFEGHEDAIWSVALSQHDRTIASCGCDKTIRLWDAETGECREILRGHKKEIKVLAFSPDGRTLASGCFEPTVKFWDVETGECRGTGKGHRTGVRSLAFSCDNKTVATGDNDQIVKLWDAQTGKCIKTLQGHTNWVWSVAFSPDGQKIASSHLDHTVRLWDTQTGECLKTLRGHTAWIWSVAFSPDGQTVASSGDDETIRLWDVSQGQFLKCLQYPTEKYQGGIWTVAFSPDRRFLASGGQDTTVKIWDIQTGNYRLLEGHHNWIFAVAFSPNGKILASGSDDQTIKIWDVTTGQCLQTLQEHTNNVRSVAFSPDGKLLVSGSEDTTLKLWDVSTGKCLKTLRGHESLVWPVKFSSNGKFIVSGSHDRTLKLWDGTTGECLNTLQEHTDQVTSIAFSSDNQTIISGSIDGTIKFWNVNTDKCLKTLRVPRPYEGTNITGVKGLTDGQKESLKALGAVEDSE